MKILFDTIIGETDVVVVRDWMRGRLSCSLEEWNWIKFVLDYADDSQLPF
jgi:hypothetical protein